MPETKPIIAAFIGIADMSAFQMLKRLSVRSNYYHEQHKLRWEKRYEKPYPESEGEIGTIEGVRWINA
ncbi:hypothetical protein LCGC14_2401330 [marine sediment metagenome]|uniref:Uncharacterized protein n=1 Tax=marine sediment metagenome TaxID=412755 RepID=A0A0F9EPP6_9ZZZZ